MLKRIFILILFVFLLTGYSYSNASTNNDLEISNKYFSFTMPDKTKGTYVVAKKDNGIFISEKVSEKSGEGGFAFGLKIFKNPKDYANIPGNKKLGELIDIKGTIYDMVLMRPSEIQYGKGQKTKENYNRLYNYGDNVEIKGINGSKYIKNQGMKGKDLYYEILEKYKKAIEEKWDSKKYEKEGLGYMYPVLSESNKNLLNKIGYAYYDIDSDGIDELLIGERIRGASKGIIYDIYTMVERRPAHVISGGNIDKYFVCNNVFLCNEYSSKASENTTSVFILENNSIELNPQIKFIYNANKTNSLYIKYGNSDKEENVSEKLYRKRKSKFNKHKKFNFTPLTQFK